MKCSESWLREWVNPPIDREQLCQVLTMGGFEVEEVTPAAPEFKDIVIGEIISVQKHPTAEQLHLCEVDAGDQQPLVIVCGADNVKKGLKTAVAKPGARLPNDQRIETTSIRGVSSNGMLCSASELGLSDESAKIIEFAADAKVGHDLREYLQLGDYVLDISITPNRGDCLSIQGMSREIAAITATPMQKKSSPNKIKTSAELFPVSIQEPQQCPHYAGRIIRNVQVDAPTPVWLKERLRRSGVRSINVIVDVTNYVMLELGQPMHAFDLDKLQGEIKVRHASLTEKILLLDGSEQTLEDDTLVIADAVNPVAIAGVMGGMDSSVTLFTQHIFLESAFFSPQTVAHARQRYGLSSESAYRFERGVDPNLQTIALERATQLILELAGGVASKVSDVIFPEEIPPVSTITLTKAKADAVLGLVIPAADIEDIFKRLNFEYQKTKASHPTWVVTVPSYRSDMQLPEDLIEEIARLYGYDKIPTTNLRANLEPKETVIQYEDILKITLADLGYQEIISYSFVDKHLQNLLHPNQVTFELVNPITADMAVMRNNLWVGLLTTLQYNLNRQQSRVRLFEIGTLFHQADSGLQQLPYIAGLITGPLYPEQWGQPKRTVDFYDMKGDLENLLSTFYRPHELSFQPDTHPSLHPGQTAAIYAAGQKIGMMGTLHPQMAQALDLSTKVYLFELNLTLIRLHGEFRFQEVSKFPEIRRDLAILVNQSIPASDIQATIGQVAGELLTDLYIFDVYQGGNIPTGYKSLALALVLQHPTRTLIESEVSDLVERVIMALKGQFGAELRS